MKIKERVTDVQRHEYTYPNPIIPLRLADADTILRALNAGKKVTATIEIERAPLPEGCRWDGNEIEHTDGARYILVNGKIDAYYPSPVRTILGVPMAEIVDAFRKEGLLP